MTRPPRDTVYQSLLSKEDSESLAAATRSHYELVAPPARAAGYLARHISVPFWLLLCLGIVQTTCISILLGYRLSGRCGHPNSQLLYSPAQDAIEYEVVKFHSGVLGGEAPDIYSLPPSDEVDKAWTDLYNFGISQISEDQAQRLVNATTEIEHSDSKYIIGIDVFHQLHCLNLIRKSLHPEYYPTPSNATEIAEREIHLAHCVNSVRQSLQCSADISTIVFNRRAPGKDEFPRFDILHSCRNYEKIKEWGMNNRARLYTGMGHL